MIKSITREQKISKDEKSGLKGKIRKYEKFRFFETFFISFTGMFFLKYLGRTITSGAIFQNINIDLLRGDIQAVQGWGQVIEETNPHPMFYGGMTVFFLILFLICCETRTVRKVRVEKIRLEIADISIYLLENDNFALHEELEEKEAEIESLKERNQSLTDAYNLLEKPCTEEATQVKEKSKFKQILDVISK